MGRGWNIAVGLVSDTTWVTPQAWRIVSRGSSTRGVPIGSGFSALIFFGSFLYKDKKEHENHSLQCFSFAMQLFNFALWNIIACIALHTGVPWCYKYYVPTGLEAVFVARCSLLVVRCSLFVNLLSCRAKRNISMGRLEILRYAQDDKWSYSCKLLVVRGKRSHPNPFPWEEMEWKKQAEA